MFARDPSAIELYLTMGMFSRAQHRKFISVAWRVRLTNNAQGVVRIWLTARFSLQRVTRHEYEFG